MRFASERLPPALHHASVTAMTTLHRHQAPHHAHPANRYASGPLDRADHLRDDMDALLELALSPQARLIPVWRQQSLIRLGPASPEAHHLPVAEALLQDAHEWVFLGLDASGAAHVAIDVSKHEEPPRFDAQGYFEDLRAVGPAMSHEEGAILALARGLTTWHNRHRFCGVCGSPTESRRGGHERKCLNLDCGAPHFPRTDPAVIMLIHDGGDRIVLGRQAVWPPGMHSVLAGFVEPGESLEDAVAREVMEEAGLPVADVRYHSSQPWPFPSSIMLGFTGRALSTELNVNTDEVEEARWYSRAELKASPEDETFKLPRRDSIARRLVDDWLAED